MYNIRLLFVSILIIPFLLSCKEQIKIDIEKKVPITDKYFNHQQGIRLPYQLYLPNSFTGWQRQKENEFIYSAACLCYEINNIDISGQQVDSWGTRFKISSSNWQHEFGFTSADNNAEQSKIGISPKGTIVQVSQISYASDIYFELPQDKQTNYLHVQFKILPNEDTNEGLLKIFYTDARR